MQNREFMHSEPDYARIRNDPTGQWQEMRPSEHMVRDSYHDTTSIFLARAERFYPRQQRRERRRGGWFMTIFVVVVLMALSGLGLSIRRIASIRPPSYPLVPVSVRPQIIPVTGAPRLVINDGSSNIHLHAGGASNQVIVQPIVEDSSGKVNMGNLNVGMSNSKGPTLINIQVNQGASSFDSSIIELDITVPNRAEVDVHTGSGSVEMSGINGQISIETKDGDIRVDNVQGKLLLKSQGGAVAVDTISGQMQVATGAGPIEVRNASLSGTSSLESTDGSVLYDGSLEPGGNYAFATGSDAQVDVTLPASASFQLSATTNGGPLQNGFGSVTVGSAPYPTITIHTNGGLIQVRKQLQ